MPPDISELLKSVPLPAIAGGAAALFVLVVLVLIVRAGMRRGGKAKADSGNDLAINVLGLESGGPPDGWPQLEFYGVPVRLAILVLAPAGRVSSIPPKEKLRETIDGLLPGLAKVVDRHRPLFRRWPEQLSTQGFAQSFFSNVKLPGDAGKKTPWCSVAGRFDTGDRHLLVGIVCCAARPNALSTVVVEHIGQWHDVLRVRRQP